MRTEKLAKHEKILRDVVQSGLEGSVLPVRTAGQNWAKLKMAIVNGGRSHIRLKAQKIQRNPGSLASAPELETLSSELALYVGSVQQVTSAGENASFWTAENCCQKVNELFSMASAVEERLAALQAACDPVLALKDSAAKQASASARSTTRTLQTQARPFVEKGMGVVWANKLVALNAIQTEDDKLVYTASASASVVSEVDDWTKPVWFEVSDGHQTGSSLLDLDWIV